MKVSYGNVFENRHDIHEEIERQIGRTAMMNSFRRQSVMIGLLNYIDGLRKRAGQMSADTYLNIMNNLREIERRL